VEKAIEASREIRNVMEALGAPDYFATLGAPLLVGETSTFQDKVGPRVAIINQTMARYYFGQRRSSREHVVSTATASHCEVVGVRRCDAPIAQSI